MALADYLGEALYVKEIGGRFSKDLDFLRNSLRAVFADQGASLETCMKIMSMMTSSGFVLRLCCINFGILYGRFYCSESESQFRQPAGNLEPPESFRTRSASAR